MGKYVNGGEGRVPPHSKMPTNRWKKNDGVRMSSKELRGKNVMRGYFYSFNASLHKLLTNYKIKIQLFYIGEFW